MSNFIDFAPEQVCYVHCHYCNTILAVSVPCSSLFNIVTVRCGHCTNLLPVNMAAMLQQAQSFSTTPHDYMLDFATPSRCNKVSTTNMMQTTKDHKEDPITINRPPEKRQRVPSAYNQFIKEEIQRIKASNPDISHREAFSTAAKNWAHFPHIHFGLMMENKQDKFDDSTGKMLMTKTAICNK